MDKKKIILWVLCIIGIVVAADLSWIFLKNNFELNAGASFCSVNALIDCDGVSRTTYSMFLGVPLAFWGMLLYLTMAFLLFVPKIQERFKNTIFDVFKNPTSYIATLALISFAISMLLACISIFTIGKICVLCFLTYILDLVIAFVAKEKGSFFFSDIKNTVLDFYEGFKKYTVLALAAIIVAAGLLYYTSTSYVLSPVIKRTQSFKVFQKMKINPNAIKGNTLGNTEGVVKVTVYSDFLCPFCGIANLMSHKLVKDDNNVQILHINFPLDSSCNLSVKQDVHPGACMVAKYALAAKEQGKYWEVASDFYDKLPKRRTPLVILEKMVLKIATDRGLDIERLKKDAASKEIASKLAQQIQYTISAGVNATPTFEINGIIYAGIRPYYELLERTQQAYRRYLNGN